MKFTKVIREFVEETLSAKLSAINKEARADYDARRNACLEEVHSAEKQFIKEINTIVSKHGFDTEVYKWGGMSEVGDAFCHGDDTVIRISAELDEIAKKERERGNAKNKAIKNLELECALGADKAKFMEMLEAIEF